MNTLEVKDFSNRSELEVKLKELGLALNPDIKPDYEISGTEEELARLNLSYRTSFFGVKCVAVDRVPPPNPPPEKPLRGEIFASGLNGQTKKP